MYAQLIGAGLGLASTLISQKKAADEQKKANQQVADQSKRLEDWYWNTKGDKTERADIQELGRMVHDSVIKRNEAAANPIAQNTVEGQAAARQQNAEDVTNFARTATSQLAQENAQNDSAYLSGKQSISDKQAAIHSQQAQNIAKAGSDMTSSMINIVGSASGNNLFDSIFGKEKTTGTNAENTGGQ